MTDTSPVFVRTEILPQQEPPLAEKGAVKWLRENLFSGWINTALTLAGIWLVYVLLVASLPWWLNSVWDVNSLGECRAEVAVKAGPEATGACWAMVRVWWHLFVFGFYPRSEYWRPVLAFALLFVAIAPVLFQALPRRMMWHRLCP